MNFLAFLALFVSLSVVLIVYIDWCDRERRADAYERDMQRFAKVKDKIKGD